MTAGSVIKPGPNHIGGRRVLSPLFHSCPPPPTLSSPPPFLNKFDSKLTRTGRWFDCLHHFFQLVKIFYLHNRTLACYQLKGGWLYLFTNPDCYYINFFVLLMDKRVPLPCICVTTSLVPCIAVAFNVLRRIKLLLTFPLQVQLVFRPNWFQVHINVLYPKHRIY